MTIGTASIPSPNPNVPRYDCTLCGASYKHLRNLRAHIHLHSGLTKCQLCNKVLCNRSYYRKHMKQQHGVLIKEEKGGDGSIDEELNDKDLKQEMIAAAVATASAATVTISPATAVTTSISARTATSGREPSTVFAIKSEADTSVALLQGN